MAQKFSRNVSAAILLVSCSVAFAGCGKEETPKINVAFGSYDSSASLLNLFIPSAHAALDNAKICLKRLRFKTDNTDASTTSGNVDFSPGLVTLTATGTTIGEVTLPAGTYKRVEFDAEKDCVAGVTANAISGTNSNGPFSSDSTTTIKFEGTFEASESGQTLSLGLQAIVTALNGLAAGASGNTVKDALEAGSSRFMVGK